MAEGQRNLSFYLSPGALRVRAVVAPVLFAVFIGLLDDRVLEPRMSNGYSHAITTAIIGVAAFVFTTFMFGLLERAYGQLEAQKAQLQRQAVELQALTQAEHQRAEEWKSLFEVGREVTASPDLEGLLGFIVSRAKRLLGTDIPRLMPLSAA